MATVLPCQSCCCYPRVVSHRWETPTRALARKIKIFGAKSRARFLWGFPQNWKGWTSLMEHTIQSQASSHTRLGASVGDAAFPSHRKCRNSNEWFLSTCTRFKHTSLCAWDQKVDRIKKWDSCVCIWVENFYFFLFFLFCRCILMT